MMEEPVPKDRRAPVRIQIEYGGEGPFLSAQSLNLSRGGVFLQTEYLLPPGRAVQLIFALPNRSRLSVLGRVVWTRGSGDPRGPAGMGIQFETITPEARQTIEDLVQNQDQKQKTSGISPS